MRVRTILSAAVLGGVLWAAAALPAQAHVLSRAGVERLTADLAGGRMLVLGTGGYDHACRLRGDHRAVCRITYYYDQDEIGDTCRDVVRLRLPRFSTQPRVRIVASTC